MLKFAVGQAVRRREDERFLKGAGRYLDDIVMPDMLHVAIHRSPYPHARILSIDVSDAMSAPGVVAIYTGADLIAAGIGPLPTVDRFHGTDEHGIRVPEHHALTRDYVRYVGDGVAMVVADTVAHARDAAERILVEYEQLPAIIETGAAIDPDAPAVWPQFGGNRCYLFNKGDRSATDAAFAQAAHIARLDLVNNRLAPAAIEPRCALGEWNEAEGQYVLHVSGQAVHSQKASMAQHIFRTDPDNIRVIAPDVGGGFGGKNFVYPENVLVMFAARKLGRPVK